MYEYIQPKRGPISKRDESSVYLSENKLNGGKVLRISLGAELVKKMGIKPADQIAFKFDRQTGNVILEKAKGDVIGFSALKGPKGRISIRVSTALINYLYLPTGNKSLIKAIFELKDNSIFLKLNKRDYAAKD